MISIRFRPPASQQPGQLNRSPFGGPLFILRGRQGYLAMILFWMAGVSSGQLFMATEGIDWRTPARTTEGCLAQPERAR